MDGKFLGLDYVAAITGDAQRNVGSYAVLLVLWLMAFSTAAQPAPARAQAPDSIAVVESEPLFTVKDAWFAGGFLVGAAALAPLDLAVAEAIQDSVPQANQVFREGADAFRVLGHPGSLLLGGTLYTAGRLADRPQVADIGLHTTEAILLAEAVTFTGKALFGRARPRLDVDDPYNLDFGRGFTHDDYQSFPSGHSSAAFATAAALTTEVARLYPESKLLVGSVLYTGASLVAVSRLYHNAHWASDIVIGAAIGSFSGWKVVRYNHTHPENWVNRLLLPDAAVPDGAGGLVLLWSARL